MLQHIKSSVSLNSDGDDLMAEKGKRECETWRV
jgi:hypothetical protein